VVLKGEVGSGMGECKKQCKVSLPRGCAGLSRGWLREFHVMHGAHLFVLLNVL
jgi:hypothetical protein